MQRRASGPWRLCIDGLAATSACVSDKSRAQEDKTSISEQLGDMEVYCAERCYEITGRYHEVGRGRSKGRPEFQRMLADAASGRFDVIACWKSDRLSRAMYPAPPSWRSSRRPASAWRRLWTRPT